MSNLKFCIKRAKQSHDMVIITNSHNNFNCLIDTGARVPVWCAGKDLLITYYPNCIKQNAKFILTGFGTGYEVADVYKIPDFILADSKQSISYHDMMVAVTNRDYAFYMILSYTMFNKMNISINTFTNKGRIHMIEPNVRISSSKGIYNVACKRVNIQSYDVKEISAKIGSVDILDSICIFNQR